MTPQDILPDSWVTTQLGEIADFTMGQAPPGSACNFDGIGTPFVKAGEFGELRPTICEWTTKPLKLARQNDILICVVGATSGKLNLGADCAIGRSVAAIRPHNGTSSKFVYYQMLRQVMKLRKAASGSAQGVISREMLDREPLVLAPEKEQSRIVEKIDGLFSDIKEGEQALERARKLLDRYRQAVLKAAVSGELTKDWREKHRGEIESGGALLTRILKARPEAWEQAELAKMRAKGQEPEGDRWKDRYKEPIANNAIDDPQPVEWTWASIDQLTSSFTNGLSKKPEDEPPGTPILRISAVRVLSVNSDDHRFYRWALGEHVEPYLLQRGDVLFTRYNGSPHLVGVCGVVASDGPMLFPDKLMRARVVGNELISPEYLALCANVGVSRRYIERRVKTSAGQHGISGAEVRSAPIPLPSPEEQAAIVECVGTLWAGLAAIETELSRRASNARSLRQSILTAAFSGKLVPQDPSDEPGSALLDRIRAERDSTSNAAVKRRGRQPARAGKSPAEPELSTVQNGGAGA